jgi:hypothetical protein
MDRKCLWCSTVFDVTNVTKLKKCCSKRCAGQYSQSKRIYDAAYSIVLREIWENTKHKRKISTNYISANQYTCICKICNKSFVGKFEHKKTCSDSCFKKLLSVSGLKSVTSQSCIRRSKNEILFYELCKNYFNSVESNKPIFNGWDADIIIHDCNTAILWNGKWHYEKITNNHSVKQVQIRDQIKIKEIENFGYIPYVIKDMGKFNAEFVNEEFRKFIAGKTNSKSPSS